jgi:hypothetical protein
VVWFGLALAILTTSACGSGSTTSPTTTAPATAPTTEVFTGTVAPGTADTHNFTLALSNGQLNVTLTAAGPPATIFMGLGVGTVSGTTCTLASNAIGVVQASSTAQFSFVQVPAGAYCVSVSDAGNQLADVTYSVTVTHY